jgi:leucyl/phenylalanyl-tRNA---protein transferase
VPLDQLHVPSRIRTYLRKNLFQLCFDRDPAAVLAACGDRKGTWLTQRIQEAYRALFELGAMHTVEAWKGDRLVGGAFGVALGTVFTVESMFSHEDHASKLAFAYLCNHLRERGFTLVDCQFQQDHFARFGAIEMSRDEYRRRIALGLLNPPSFKAPPSAKAGAEASGAGNSPTGNSSTGNSSMGNSSTADGPGASGPGPGKQKKGKAAKKNDAAPGDS